MSRTGPTPQNGFTLIEAMVALVILSVAAVGIVRAAEAHIDTLHGLERRASAQWVAENALAEATLANGTGVSGSSTDQPMLAWRWTVRSAMTGATDPDLRQIRVDVRGPGQRDPQVTLRGFLDTGAAPAAAQ